MRTSDSTAKIDVAIAKAQRNVTKAIKDSNNPHFGSKYADLASVSDACLDAFTAEGIAIIQAPSADGQKVTVTTRLAMAGEFYESDFTVTAAQAGPQQVTACVTYGRRAGLAAMTGVTPDDDDGETAEGRGAGKAARKERPQGPTQTNGEAREAVKAALAPPEAYKLEALKEATAILGDAAQAKAYLNGVREDPQAKRPWTIEDCEKIKGALALLRAKGNQAHATQ